VRTGSITAIAVSAALIVPLGSVAADAASPVRMSRVQYDSPGADSGSNASLNAEWVRVTNHSARKRSLTGWTLRDPQSHVYRFPTFTLRPGASVRVHTGSGSNTRTDLYWRSDYYVWNNSGDKAILKTKSGTTVDTCKWGDGSGVTGC
jgi:hypothetical protein